MTFNELKDEAMRYAPALWLDTVLPYSYRHIGKVASFMLLAVLSVPAAFFLLLENSQRFATVVYENLSLFSPIFPYRQEFIGGALLVLGLWLFFFALDAFYFSLLLSDEAALVPEIPQAPAGGRVTIDAAVLALSVGEDVTASYCRSHAGRELLMRLSISDEDVELYLGATSRVPVNSGTLIFPDSGSVGFASYTTALSAADPSFRSFFRERAVSQADFDGAALWIESMAARIRRRRRSWGRDRLGRAPALGTSFSYGRAYSLERFGMFLADTTMYRSAAPLLRFFRKEVDDLETILVRERGANAVVVAEDNEAPLSVVIALAHLIERGEVLPPLEHKRLFLLDPNKLTAFATAKAAFEAAFQKSFSEAVSAGNIIVVIPDFSAFVASAKALGADVPGLLAPYLRQADVHVIALSESGSFHRSIERDPALTEEFETVLVTQKGNQASLTALQRIAEDLERRTSAVYSFTALSGALAAAESSFADTTPLDKATDLLLEAASARRGAGGVIGPDDIKRLVETKTGIPAGGPGSDERVKLLKLEELIRKRVVSQGEAAAAVAGALRRARAGLANPKRPLGSFLFLGPTGVGKTETVKALAEVYFHDERAIMRFDMSEFSGFDGVKRLIGSAESGEPGLLASRLREKPYAVILLDEFEKSSPEVRDLFLQILDEGIFTDSTGKRVSARNTFIIATSNAASDEIFRIVEEGKDLAAEKSRIIDSIVAKGLYRPELINRFDGVILFHPVAGETIMLVARQLLERFAKRMADKGYQLVINEPLVAFIAAKGGDPKFGARPLNRAIEEHVEQAIADKIISGDLKPGAKIEFTAEDFK